MQGSTVLTERVGDVGVITLNRPEKLNALNRALMEDFEAAVRATEEDGVRALLLTGAGRGFCSGADLTAPKGEEHISGRESLFKSNMPLGYPSLLLREFPRPTVAAVNGPAVGAGFGMALACDIRVASESAKFSAIFARRALTPDYGVTQLLPMAVGMSLFPSQSTPSSLATVPPRIMSRSPFGQEIASSSVSGRCTAGKSRSASQLACLSPTSAVPHL